jgi:hypothetical protein
MRSLNFSIYLILPVALGPGVYLTSNINEYQKQKEMFLGSRARQARKADNFTTIYGNSFTLLDTQQCLQFIPTSVNYPNRRTAYGLRFGVSSPRFQAYVEQVSSCLGRLTKYLP